MSRLVFCVLVAALVVPVAAYASTPPSKPVVVTPRSIDGNVLAGNDAGFVLRIKADRYFGGDSSQGASLTWTHDGVDWAGMSRYSADNRTASFAYFGPFKTTKGDTNGTTLAGFKRHWPGARVFSTGVAWNVLPPGSKVLFGFNRSARLVGVTLGWGQPMFAGSGVNEVGRKAIAACFYPKCSWDSSPYDG